MIIYAKNTLTESFLTLKFIFHGWVFGACDRSILSHGLLHRKLSILNNLLQDNLIHYGLLDWPKKTIFGLIFISLWTCPHSSFRLWKHTNTVQGCILPFFFPGQIRRTRVKSCQAAYSLVWAHSLHHLNNIMLHSHWMFSTDYQLIWGSILPTDGINKQQICQLRVGHCSTPNRYICWTQQIAYQCAVFNKFLLFLLFREQ